MKQWMILAVLVLVSAGPSTRPATLPANASTGERYIAAQAERQACEKELADARELAAKAAIQSQAYKDAKVDADAKLRDLEAARAGGSAEVKLAASAAYVRARGKADAAKTAYLKDDAGIKSAAARLAEVAAVEVKAKAALDEDLRAIAKDKEEADKREEAEKMKDPIYAAVKQGRILVGMTEAQLKAALDRNKFTMSSHSDEFLRGERRMVRSTYTPGGATIDTPFKRIIVEDGIVTEIKTFGSGDFVPTPAHF